MILVVMISIKTSVNPKYFAVFAVFLAFFVIIRPVRAEISPDAGLEWEQALEDQILLEKQEKEVQAIKAAKEQEAKLVAKKKAERVVALERARAQAALKKATDEKRALLGETISINEGINVSIASKNIPQGLSPTIISQALDVKPGDSAALTIKTLPGASCDIDVFIVTRVPISASGLEAKIADSEGICQWKWLVRKNTTRGSWGVRVVSAKDGKSDDLWTTLNVGNVH